MKEFKNIMVFALVSAIATCPLYSYAIGDKDTPVSTAITTNQLKITGIVTYNSLETGFYEVDGYRLEGEYDFGKYEGKAVVVTGEISNSMSIFMTKAIKVDSIKLRDEDVENGMTEKAVDEVIAKMEDTKSKMLDVIKKHGDDSAEAIKYKEEIKMLRDSAVKSLEELVKTDGRNKDISKYEKLGKVFSINEEKAISVYIDGIKTVFEPNALPFIDSGRTLVPFRAVAEGLGAEVSWDDEAKKVTVKKGERIVELIIGKTAVNMDEKTVELDVPAKIVNGRTVIPLRFIGESLDTTVEWISKGQIVVISSNADSNKPMIDSTDFSVKYNNRSIKLGDWDDKINITEIFGEPISEKIEQIGPGADTFTGSYIKEVKYDGLVLGLMSPKDNGKTFFVRTVDITKDAFVTARGVKVGDSYNSILEKYMYTPLWETNYDPKNHEYILKDEGYYYIKFDVREGAVKSISIYWELP